MITFQRIASYVGAEPFRPFRITTAGGRTYEIGHPEMIRVGRSTITIFKYMVEEADDASEREVEVSLLLTESVEPLDTQDILGYLRAEPFRPFQFRMTSGRTFVIRHPEMVRVGRGSLIIFSSVSDDPAIFDRWDTVSLMLIENVTHHEAPAA